MPLSLDIHHPCHAWTNFSIHTYRFIPSINSFNINSHLNDHIKDSKLFVDAIRCHMLYVHHIHNRTFILIYTTFTEKQQNIKGTTKSS